MNTLKNMHQEGYAAARAAALSSVVLLLMALVALSGCGGDNNMMVSEKKTDKDNEADAASTEDVPEAERPDQDLLNFAMAISGEVCAKMFECCSSDERINKLGMSSESVEQCADQSGFLGFAFGYGQFDDSIKAGRIAVDIGMADLCLGAIRETSCGNFSALTSVDRFVPGCRAVFAPLVEQGGSCTLDQECISGACLSDEAAGKSTCEPLPTDGKPCPDYRCADGLYCDSFLVGVPTCLPQRAPGESCGDPSECESEYCAANGDGDLVCQTKAAVCQGA